MLTLFIWNFRCMPTVRRSFTSNGQNFEIPKIDFCDVITSVLYIEFDNSVGKKGTMEQWKVRLNRVKQNR